MHLSLNSISNWCLMVTIVAAPVMMGSIPQWGETNLVRLSYLTVLIHVITAIIRRRFLFSRSFFLWALVTYLLAHGWWMVFNAKYILDEPTYKLVPLSDTIAFLPGTYDYLSSFNLMYRITAFLLLALIVPYMLHSSLWRKRFLYTIVGTAALVTLYGIVQKITGAGGLWPQYGKNVWPFATYYYHGNAGAFINFAIPLAAGLVLRRFLDDKRSIISSLWPCALVVLLAGSVVNASKGAMIVTAWVILLLCIPALFAFTSNVHNTFRQYLIYIISGGIFLAAMLVVMFSGGIESSWERWNHALDNKDTIYQGRLAVSKVCYSLGILGGWTGLGPDTFHVVFPYVVPSDARFLYGFWRHAHHDYLQTFMEWGKLGSLAWACLIFGAIAIAINRSVTGAKTLKTQDRIYLFCVAISLVGCATHSLFDFPLQIPSLQLNMTVLCGYAWSSLSWQRPFHKKNRKSNRTRRFKDKES